MNKETIELNFFQKLLYRLGLLKIYTKTEVLEKKIPVEFEIFIKERPEDVKTFSRLVYINTKTNTIKFEIYRLTSRFKKREVDSLEGFEDIEFIKKEGFIYTFKFKN